MLTSNRVHTCILDHEVHNLIITIVVTNNMPLLNVITKSMDLFCYFFSTHAAIPDVRSRPRQDILSQNNCIIILSLHRGLPLYL